MEIFEIYQFISTVATMRGVTPAALYTSLALSFGIWLVLFILQGIGVYVMAKKRGYKHLFLAFVPFASLYYLGKLAGTCYIFGNKMKRAGLYTMIAAIVSAFFCGTYVASEILLFTKYIDYMIVTETGYTWSGLSGFGMFISNYRYYGTIFVSISRLAYTVLLFILMTGLFKQYATRNYLMFSWLVLFFPIVRGGLIFAFRSREPIDFEAYMQRRREEFLRRQQQQYNPYNPYNPYQQPPYNGAPYNPPYGQNPSYPNQNPPQSEPFGEFSNPKPPQAGAQSPTSGGENKKDDSDDLFN